MSEVSTFQDEPIFEERDKTALFYSQYNIKTYGEFYKMAEASFLDCGRKSI